MKTKKVIAVPAKNSNRTAARHSYARKKTEKAAMILDAEMDLKAMREKYNSLDEWADIIKAIDDYFLAKSKKRDVD